MIFLHTQKNIIGIGRDDATTLVQKQSQNPTDSIRIFLNRLAVSNASNTGTFTKNISHVVMGDNGKALSRNFNSVVELPGGLFSRLEREWKIVKTNFSQSFSIDIKLNAFSIPESVNVSDLRLLVDDDGNFGNGGTTVFQNGDASGTVITYSNGLISILDLNNTHIPDNSTRYFTIASAAITTPLPIELINFDASLENAQIALMWQTGSERNNDFFTVERSEDGVNWEEIDQVKGAGSSSTVLNYKTFDDNPLSGVSYYRLKQTDYDGMFTYSEVESVNIIRSKNSKVLIYPNPAENQVTVEADKSELIDVRIFDILGKDVTSLAEITRENATRIVIDVVNLPKGVYNVRTKTITTKVILE